MLFVIFISLVTWICHISFWPTKHLFTFVYLLLVKVTEFKISVGPIGQSIFYTDLSEPVFFECFPSWQLVVHSTTLQICKPVPLVMPTLYVFPYPYGKEDGYFTLLKNSRLVWLWAVNVVTDWTESTSVLLHLLFPALPGFDLANIEGSMSSILLPFVLNKRCARSSSVL